MADITFSERVVNAVNSAFTFLGLGETSSTAYRGDRGKTAYDHSQVVTGNPHGTTAGDIGAYTSSQTDTLLDGKVDENSPITGATKTKLTYDSKGLVTSGSDATTADINPSTDRNYLTDANQTKVNAIDQSVSSAEKSTWNGKQNNLGFTPLSVTNNLSDLDDVGVAKGNLSLENVNNTSDLNKPISTATQTALDLKVDKEDVMQSIRTASINETITAGYSAVVVRKFRINSGIKLTINTGSTFRIL
jgi:hypothetical protein